MKIIFKESFIQRLENQIEYIASDSPVQARKFKSDLIARINQIPINPYQYRKSIYFDNYNIRDLIFKGYTIVFQIKKEHVEVFGFVKYLEKPD